MTFLCSEEVLPNPWLPSAWWNYPFGYCLLLLLLSCSAASSILILSSPPASVYVCSPPLWDLYLYWLSLIYRAWSTGCYMFKIRSPESLLWFPLYLPHPFIIIGEGTTPATWRLALPPPTPLDEELDLCIGPPPFVPPRWFISTPIMLPLWLC